MEWLEFLEEFYVVLLPDDRGILVTDKSAVIDEFIHVVQNEGIDIDDVKVFCIGYGGLKQKVCKLLSFFANPVESEGFIIENVTEDIFKESFEKLAKVKPAAKKTKGTKKEEIVAQ